MSRPAGVTASAVVAVIGSALVLLTAGFVGVAIKAAPTDRPSMPPGFGSVLAGMIAFMVACAALGTWTGIAMWKLRPWARISTLVFAGVLAAFAALSMLIMLALPSSLPPDAAQQVAFATIRPVVVGVYAVPFAIGVWWLVYFNRPSIKAAFAAPFVPGAPPARPLSISIIGWMSVVGAAFILPAALIGAQAFLAGLILTGWSARLTYLVLGSVSGYLGWSVLRLRESGRRLMIGWYVLGMAHGALIFLVPGVQARFVESQRLMPFRPEFASSAPPMTGTLAAVIMGGVAVFGAVIIWFLVRERARFS